MFTSPQVFKAKYNEWLNRIDQPRGKIYVFRGFKIPKNSILKQIEIEIVGVTQDLKKLQIDK